MTQHMVRSTIIIVLLLVCIRVTVAVDTLTITAARTNIRAKPDMTQTILATVQRGTVFSILEIHQGWYKIRLEDGREGWITKAAAQVQHERAVSPVQPVSSAVPVPRFALVIGNAAYTEDIGPLQNPINDATGMATAL